MIGLRLKLTLGRENDDTAGSIEAHKRPAKRRKLVWYIRPAKKSCCSEDCTSLTSNRFPLLILIDDVNISGQMYARSV